MKYHITFILFGLVFSVLATSPGAKVEEKIWENLEQADHTNILVTFKKANTKAAYDRFHALKLTNRAAILDAQHAILKDHADIVQADVTSMLTKAAVGKKHRLDVLWISNELIVRDVDKEVVEMLRTHPDVESLQAEWFIPMQPIIEGETVSDENHIQNQWGVVRVRAPQVWTNNGNQGQGVTVGITDTGARATHVNLAPTYRGNNPGQNHNYNWRAPNNNAAVPADTNGHGTHVIGTISGTGGIGVAPQSRWMVCRGCGALLCSNLDLLTCGNFMACPTDTNGNNPNCAMAPRMVNNSWGGGQGNTFYNAIITAWRNAGIIPIFAAGNSGPNCGTVNSPSDQPGALSVASTAENDHISNFSSVGPGPGNSQKPEVAAPGSNVVSATHLADVGTRSLSGTSMAAPHVAGVACLVLSGRPNLGVDAVINELIGGSLAHLSQNRTCSDRSEAQRPNFHVGHGLVDAVNAVAPN